MNDTISKDTPPKPYKLVVFLGLKTIIVLFLKNDKPVSIKTLSQLNVHLSKQVPILSQLLDEFLSKSQ